MRKRSRFMLSVPVVAAAAVLLACGSAHGRASPEAPARAGESSPAVTPASQETLGPELRQLNALAGEWAVQQSMWVDPARPPAVDKGTATFTPVLGGRHLRQDLHIDSAKGPFQGLGYLGYDHATRRYDSLWMDVNFTGMLVAHGSYDASRRVYELTGAMPDPHHAGSTIPLREVMRVQDADHFTYEYYEHHDGREMLAVRLEYTRRK